MEIRVLHHPSGAVVVVTEEHLADLADLRATVEAMAQHRPEGDGREQVLAMVARLDELGAALRNVPAVSDGEPS